MRHATDRDHDGFSPYFGGGDCDDHDPKRNPQAFDVPGNGIDEDCSGSDTPLPPPPPPPPAPPKAKLPDDLNLILITVDTLRRDCGFCGYDKDTTPNLDALAKKSVILGSGQSFMIAGLLQNRNRNNIEKAPFLGDIPILGLLFRSTSYQRDETELVIVVTPYLVRPVSHQLATPGDGLRAPTDAQINLGGQSFSGKTGAREPTAIPAPRAAAPGFSL